MFFVLSKTLSFLVQPLVIVCIILLAGLVVRNTRYKKRLLLTGFLLLLFFSNEFIAIEAVRGWEVPVTPLSEIRKRYDYGILLTGVTKTTAIPRDRVYFARGADRATHTLQLYKLGIIRKVVVSGGSGRVFERDFREADELAGFFLMAGIPGEDLIIENNSNNTHESAVAVSALIEGLPGSRDCLLITSGYHVRRASACFNKAGLHADTFSTDPLAHPRVYGIGALLVPNLDAIGIWQSLFKEWTGMIAYWLAGYI